MAIPVELKANASGFSAIADIWVKSVTFPRGSKVLYDFDSCRDVDANLASMLGAMLDRLTDLGYSMFVNSPKNRVALKSLSRIGFLKAFEVTSNIEEKENFIKYCRFEVDEYKEFKQYILEDLIKKKRFPHCTEKAAEKIIENIYEVFANAVTHGGSKYIYSCGESHERNGSPTLEFAISNIGRTVSDNVNKLMRDRQAGELDDAEAIKWAFAEGHTTKLVPGGLGLAILRDFISLNRGRIQFASGRGVVELDGPDFAMYSLSNAIPGTVVNLSFNCSDKNSYFLKSEAPNLQDLL